MTLLTWIIFNGPLDKIAQAQLVAEDLRTLADLELFRNFESVGIDLITQLKCNGEKGGFWWNHGGDAASCQLAHNIQGEGEGVLTST